MKKVMKILMGVFLLCSITFSIILFTTDIGYKLRVTAAEMILTSQHRHWAKYTFLPKEKLNEILYKVQNPLYENSVKTTTDSNNTEQVAENVGFQNNDLEIKLETIEKYYSPTYFYKGKVLEVSNPLNVKLVSSSKESHGEQIFVIADRADAIAAINASGFVDENGRGNGGSATGVVIEDGEIKNKYPHIQDFVAGITEDGEMITGKYSANELVDLNVRYAAGFKPQLIVNGKKMINGDGGWGVGPRSAIGQKEDGTIVMVVIDGRQPSRSLGATLKEVQDIMYERGVVQAMAMDGGSSSSMYFDGENITTPSSRNNIPRYLPNIWAVVPMEGQDVEVYADGEKVDIE